MLTDVKPVHITQSPFDFGLNGAQLDCAGILRNAASALDGERPAMPTVVPKTNQPAMKGSFPMVTRRP